MGAESLAREKGTTARMAIAPTSALQFGVGEML